jgi:hypothetical protein
MLAERTLVLADPRKFLTSETGDDTAILGLVALILLSLEGAILRIQYDCLFNQLPCSAVIDTDSHTLAIDVNITCTSLRSEINRKRGSGSIQPLAFR